MLPCASAGVARLAPIKASSATKITRNESNFIMSVSPLNFRRRRPSRRQTSSSFPGRRPARLHACGLLLPRRDRERHPGIPAMGAVLGLEFLIPLEQEHTRILAHREQEAKLRPDPDHLRLEIAEPRARSGIAGELVIEIADPADEHLLGQELRGAPVEMPVDAVL